MIVLNPFLNGTKTVTLTVCVNQALELLKTVIFYLTYVASGSGDDQIVGIIVIPRYKLSSTLNPDEDSELPPWIGDTHIHQTR